MKNKNKILISCAIIFASCVIGITLYVRFETIPECKSTPVTSSASDWCESLDNELYKLHNDYREAMGLPTFYPNDKLAFVAKLKIEEMIEYNYWDHKNPETGQVSTWSFMKAEGYEYLLAGENLGKDYNYADEIMNFWINSPEHKKNLDGDYTDIGIAVDCDERYKQGNNLVVVVFGKPNQLENR